MKVKIVPRKRDLVSPVWENALFPPELDLERRLVHYAKVSELQEPEIDRTCQTAKSVPDRLP
jgi:hypothetical protein